MSVSSYFDIPAATTVMKELYDGQSVENMVYKKNVFFAMIPKKTNFEGKSKPIPLIYGNSQGRSASFINAQGNQTALSSQEFLLKRVKDYSIATIDNETMMASKSDKGAFVEGLKVVGDSAFRAIENSLASALFRTSTGSVGQISSISSGVITLVNAGDVVQFEVNQTLQANATDGGTPRAALGYVIAVARSAGTVTVASSGLGGSAATPSGWTTNDFILTQGDNNLKMSGLASWLPFTAPTAGDSFFNVDRSVDTWRLGGGRYDGSGQSIEEALIDSSTLLAREGGVPTHFMTNFASFAALEKSLGSKVQYSDLRMGEIGFKGIQVNGVNSTVTVLADRSCQPLTGYLLQMDTWCLNSAGPAPHILDYGDGQILRVYNADAAEMRVGFYGNVSCSAPGWSCNVKLGA